MTRPIVLPAVQPVVKATAYDFDAVVAYARAAVEADRKAGATEYAMAVHGNYETLLREVQNLRRLKSRIVVTDEDVEDAAGRGVRGGLESFAKRLRGETP